MASWKILLFDFLIASLMFNFVSPSSWDEKANSQKKINDFVMSFNEKLDHLSDRVDRMETKGNYAIDVHEIITNITHLIIKRTDKNSKKFEKLEEKLNGMESILLDLKNASEDVNRGRSDDVWRGVTSLCEDKVATWANATSLQIKANLDRIDFCIRNEQKALNACHPNPCLHGGRCLLNSTGNQYVCECPKFTSGSRCEIIETMLRWAEAKVSCEGLNMTLAMPKNEESNRFLKDQLGPIYTTRPYYWLWIGLKRVESGWGWVDGSALGEYNGMHPYVQSQTGLLFGQLSVGGGGSEVWSVNIATHQFYSICETRLFAN